MSEFVHLLLTRFNVAVGYGDATVRLQDQWLEDRFRLFEEYCLPSVAGQTGVTFEWIVFCDSGSPTWMRTRMKRLSAMVSCVYIEGRLSDEVIAKNVAGTGKVTAPYLITTRLDSDDALARDHLATVQRVFRGQEREFVEFPVGLQSYRGHLYNVFYRGNPFLSLIEKVDPSGVFSTVHCVEHTLVRRAGTVRSILRPPLWLQVLHSSNVGNSLRGVPRVQSRTHWNFDVKWPCIVPRDSLTDRMRCSSEAFAGGARRRLGRVFRLGTPGT